MMTVACETARDHLPELVSGTLDGLTAAALERHLTVCAACAEERAVVALVRASSPVPPAILEARVARAVRAKAEPRGAPVSVRPLAIAAAAAFALLTGGLLLRDVEANPKEASPGMAGVTLGWPIVQDPILRATPTLHDLSVEELESLLAELES